MCWLVLRMRETGRHVLIFTLLGILSILSQGRSEGAEPAPPGRPHPPDEAPVTQKLLVLPLDNHSRYDGQWDLSRGIARMLSEVLAEEPYYTIVAFDSLGALGVDLPSIPEVPLPGRQGRRRKQRPLFTAEEALRIGRAAGADYVLRGTVKSFDYTRLRAGVAAAGFSSSSAYVEIEGRPMKTIDGKELPAMVGDNETSDRDVGTPLILSSGIGKRETEYYELGSMEFGSKEFRASLMGNSLMAALHQLAGRTREVIKPPAHLGASSPKVVWVGEDGVYVNVGAEDNIQAGDKLGIYVEGDEQRDPVTGIVLGRLDEKRIAVIQISDVKASHFSKAKVIQKNGTIPVNAVLRSEAPPDTARGAPLSPAKGN